MTFKRVGKMKLNRTVRGLLSTTLASIACAGLIATVATSAQASDREPRPAQRVERPPAPPEPAPTPRPPVRQPDTRQVDRLVPADVPQDGAFLDVEIRL